MPPSSAATHASLLLLAAWVAIGACHSGITSGARFPTCESDADCKKRSPGGEAPICFELRCVPCRFDDHCPAGHSCSTANECERFMETPSAEKDAGPLEESWEPSPPADRQRCLAACRGKGKECTARCGK